MTPVPDPSRCLFGDGCVGWRPQYPADYRDPEPRRGEPEQAWWGRVFAARQEALAESMNAHIRTHPGLEGLRFVLEAG